VLSRGESEREGESKAKATKERKRLKRTNVIVDLISSNLLQQSSQAIPLVSLSFFDLPDRNRDPTASSNRSCCFLCNHSKIKSLTGREEVAAAAIVIISVGGRLDRRRRC